MLLLMLKDNRKRSSLKCFKVIYKEMKGIQCREWETLDFFKYSIKQLPNFHCYVWKPNYFMIH